MNDLDYLWMYLNVMDCHASYPDYEMRLSKFLTSERIQELLESKVWMDRAVDVLFLAGKVQPPEDVQKLLLTQALKRHVEIRDCVVGVVESWESSFLIPILENHEEFVPWLNIHILDVIRDLRESND